VQVRDQHPQQTQQADHQKGVVQPQPAARITRHQNACSLERPFERKTGAGHKHVSVLTLCGAFSWKDLATPRSAPPRWPRTGRWSRWWALLLVALLPLVGGCLADAHKTQSIGLLDQLVGARTLFQQQPPEVGVACNEVGDVQTRLYGEPGLVDVRPGWPALRDAAAALQSVCGQNLLLGQGAANESMVLALARDRWQQGIEREIGVACDHLREAAIALDRSTPC
jgi:hypothetical protein